jgi:cobalt/nickel transport system permease protein
MHLPDHYLSPATCAVLGGAMVPVWAVAARRVRAGAPERLPLLGVAAAFCFLVMMFNAPAPGGTTVHAVGGTLAAVLLGPASACLAISAALLIQALGFGDGGVLAYGANCFNLALVVPGAGYLFYHGLRRLLGPRREAAALGLAAYLALALGALCAGVELGLQPVLARDAAGLPNYCPYPLAVAVPGLLAPHLLVGGWVEAGFTVAVHGFLRRVAPDRLGLAPAPRPWALAGLLALLAGLCPLGLLARGSGWGEWDPATLLHSTWGGRPLAALPPGMAVGRVLAAPLDGYGLPGLPAWQGYLLSAAAGAAALVIAWKLLGLARRVRAGRP